MQTVATLAKRLDNMTAEMAVEKLQYMLFEVEGVESKITDEQCDILIDVDDDPSIADRIREEKLKEQEKARKRTERLQKAAKKAAAKRKAKPAARTPAAAGEDAEGSETEAQPAETGEEAASAAPARAEILPREDEPEVAETPAEVEASPAEDEAAASPAAPAAPAPTPTPTSETAPPTPPAPPPQPAAKAKKEEAKKKEKRKETEVGLTIGRAIEHEQHSVEIVRADGTSQDTFEDAVETAPEPITSDDQEDDDSPKAVAEAEREQEEAELRKPKARTGRPAVKPDPAVVAEVKRKAAERTQRPAQRAGQAARPGQARTGQARPGQARGRSGKTARKKQKKAEKARQEEALRRSAAAAVKEYQSGAMGGQRKRRRKRRDEGDAAGQLSGEERQILEIEETITVEELAEAMDMGVNDIILDLMEHDVLATKNQALDIALVRTLAEPYGYEVQAVIPEEDKVLAEEPDDPADLRPRAPVVTVMGHVDHGKTSLLDRVREANVAGGEEGGITQHIAAYDVPIRDSRVVFLDTPGHAAFTEMRARGAQITDIVVLVVAADDGVMPQTAEAIDHARAASVPIVVAVNKCDKPDAQPEKIRQELTRYELVDEAWGGKTIMRDISALNGDGINELMEMLVLEAELLELKANANKRARGAVIESEISRGQGPVAWVLVQSGTLRTGDVFLAGQSYGRVRAMFNARNESIEEAGPSTPVVVAGFDAPPDAGDQFVVVEEERIARVIAEKRRELARQKQGQPRRITLEDLQQQLKSGEKRELNVVLKADVQGSVDVFVSSLERLGNEEVRVQLVHTGVGGINESDVLLASASEAVIIGFHVTANPKAAKLAEQEGVDIRTYRVIYEAIDDVRKALEGMLEPDKKEVVTGHAEIRQVFRSSGLGNIAGCYVRDGEITRGSLARLIRDDVVVYDGKLSSLKRVKEDVRAVASGYECGIKLDKFEDIKEGDVIETYREEAVAKKLV